jgi:beta-lactamase regulating signal transducer with metallopeptidase domain
MFGHATAWLLTYALHSTLLLTLAWLASGSLARRSLRLEEVVWRVALLGALATSTFQVATGWHPVAALRLPAASMASIEKVATPAPAATPASLPMPEVSLSRVAELSPAPAAVRRAAVLPVADRPMPVPATSRSAVWMARLLVLWATIAFLLSLRLAFAHLGLRRRLRARLEVSGGTLFRILDRLAPETGISRPIRLTCSTALPVPVALGVLRPEIAVPPRALSHLSAGEQESLLAHELAHLVRRDPAWLAGSQLLASLLFFQPLNWVARRRLREISELLSDEWAVGRTGEPLALARCLTEVAQWTLGPVRLLPVPGMADRPSNLGRRIHRLLDGERERHRMPRWGLAALGVLLLSIAVAAPGFTAPEQPAPPTPPSAPEIASAPEPPEAPEALEAPDAPELAEAPEAPAPPVLAPAPPALPAPPLRAPRAAKPRRLSTPLRPDLAPLAPLPDPPRPHDLTAEEKVEIDAAGAEGAAEAAEIARISAAGRLNQEEIARIQSDADRMARDMEERLKPQMKEMEKLAAQMAAERPSDAEIRALEHQVDIATRHLRSPEEEARFEADVRKLTESAGTLSVEEKKHLHEDIRRMAESMRPRPEDIAAMKKLAERHGELSRQLSHEQVEKMKALRGQMEKEMAALRQTMQHDLAQQLKGMHEELQREKELREARPRPLHPRPRIAPQAAPAPLAPLAPTPHPGAIPAPAPRAAPAPLPRPALPEGAVPPTPPPAAPLV